MSTEFELSKEYKKHLVRGESALNRRHKLSIRGRIKVLIKTLCYKLGVIL